MNIYLITAFVLLLAMLALVLRPFLYATEPALDGDLDLTDPAAKARSVAKVERVSRPATAPAAAATATAVVTADTAEAPADAPVVDAPVVDAPPVDDSSVHDVSTHDVRASVEAAIAARKAALKAKHCSSCEAVLEDGDAFCRACGTKATA
jgi:hypothetical protein